MSDFDTSAFTVFDTVTPFIRSIKSVLAWSHAIKKRQTPRVEYETPQSDKYSCAIPSKFSIN